MNQRPLYLTEQIRLNDGSVPSSALTKHKKMAFSPFVFYRGTAPLFYSDIANSTIDIPDVFKQLPNVYVMGDCHTSNFGFFTEEGSHSNSVIFAPNDFDDACVGHSIWDVVRYCTALYLCKAHCDIVQPQHQKAVVDHEQVERAVSAFINTYADTCRNIESDTHLLTSALDTFSAPQKLHKIWSKAIQRSNGGALFEEKSAIAKATVIKDGQLAFRDDPAKFSPLTPEQYHQLQDAFAPYMDNEIVDITQRLNAGTGSVSLERYYFLVGPKGNAGHLRLSDYHIVEVKQQKVAAPVRASLLTHPVNKLNPAHLTARCQKHMQRRPDLLLDEVEWNNSHWLVRSRHHAKVGIDPEDIATGKRNIAHEGLVFYATQCAQALALAHCRTDRRTFSYESTASKAYRAHSEQVKNIAQQYAQQVVSDYAWFCSSLKSEAL
ncbi:DUF2252 domain-containing protein [Alteromonas sediminis]|uniref:DUF2252 domain-containing protein n=1 Tax=Alteromonas sediminis TaxID=2259342 RepID=A0A3N5Y3P1_9ALTE|nr:DUF2252 family protein [Alteromonas sediminis]RPJ68687.1 DUF2252 domain-containing protein [Alteromonas sediminis]